MPVSAFWVVTQAAPCVPAISFMYRIASGCAVFSRYAENGVNVRMFGTCQTNTSQWIFTWDGTPNILRCDARVQLTLLSVFNLLSSIQYMVYLIRIDIIYIESQNNCVRFSSRDLKLSWEKSNVYIYMLILFIEKQNDAQRFIRDRIFHYKYLYCNQNCLYFTFCVGRLDEAGNRESHRILYSCSVCDLRDILHAQHIRSRFSSRKHPKFVGA